MTKLATYDALTGLLNRHTFYESCHSLSDYCKRSVQTYCILVVDLDFFKSINDTYGHATGDKVLASFGQISQEMSRNYDLIGHLGGEEFAFFLANTNIQEATRFAQRLREKINASTIVYEGQTIKYTISIGISSNEQNSKISIDKLLATADKELYNAKHNGRNQEVIHKVELAN